MNDNGKGATNTYSTYGVTGTENKTVKRKFLGMDWAAADYEYKVDVYGEIEKEGAVNQDAVDMYNARIDYIEALGLVSDDMISSWRTSKDMAATEKLIVETYLPQAIEAQEQLAILEDRQNAEILKLQRALASTATTAAELE
jgi:hypothetical protein